MQVGVQTVNLPTRPIRAPWDAEGAPASGFTTQEGQEITPKWAGRLGEGLPPGEAKATLAGAPEALLVPSGHHMTWSCAQ